MIAIAGSFGALARYQPSAMIQRCIQSSVPFRTAVVNLVGAFGLGLVLGSDPIRTVHC
jgi:fluoride ion exporter CrcB/FEX